METSNIHPNLHYALHNSCKYGGRENIFC